MLDDLDPRPIYIDADDLHSAWLNAPALMELSLADKPDPEGGKIHRDEHGNPSGLLEEAAVVTIVWPHLSSALSHDEKLACLIQAIKKFNETGITAAIDMAMNEDYWNLLHELYMSGQLTLRIAAHFIVMPSKTEDETQEKIRNIIKIREKFNRGTSPSFWVAGIKIICDGVVDACTAAISRPYMTEDEAKPFWDPENMNKVLKTADEVNLQCALHAIGDDAVNMAINGLESLGTSGRRHRIEHLELTRPEDARRLGRLEITASIQPVHCDPEINDLWPKLIGHDLCGRAFAYKEFYSHGAPIAIGSDTPTAPHIPWNNIYNATTRRSFRRPEETATINEHFKLSLETTL